MFFFAKYVMRIDSLNFLGLTGSLAYHLINTKTDLKQILFFRIDVVNKWTDFQKHFNRWQCQNMCTNVPSSVSHLGQLGCIVFGDFMHLYGSQREFLDELVSLMPLLVLGKCILSQMFDMFLHCLKHFYYHGKKTIHLGAEGYILLSLLFLQNEKLFWFTWLLQSPEEKPPSISCQCDVKRTSYWLISRITFMVFLELLFKETTIRSCKNLLWF